MSRAPLDVEVSSAAHTHICHHSPHGIRSECPLRCSTIHGNTGEWTEMGLLTRLERSKRSTLVISSTDLIPPSITPSIVNLHPANALTAFQRDPHRFAISFNTSKIAGSRSDFKVILATVSQSFQIPSALLDHPINDCTFQWHHMS